MKLFTGGGFSNNIAASSFQTTAVNSYFSQYSATQSSYSQYTRTNRAYPDLSLAGNLYVVAIDNAWVYLDGTSCSAPSFAGMVSLVNAYRLKHSKPTLGWINPSLYSSNGTYCNDITSGNNFCTADSTSVSFFFVFCSILMY